MKMKKSNQAIDTMEEDEAEAEAVVEDLEEVTDTPFEEENSDLCQRLMERYGKSSAAQHRHLCASASAMRTILQDEGLPLTPLAYFAATISAINDASESLGSNATAALSSFLSILLPLVPSQSLSPSKAIDAVSVLVEVLQKPTQAVSPATLRSVIKSLEILMRLCDLKDWDALKLPFETILAFSVDKRPKVRKCAQVCVEEVFKSFQCSIVIKKASKVILSLFQSYLPLAIELTAAPIVAGCKSEMLSKPEHLEVLHMLNVLKLVFPCLSNKVSIQIMSELYKLLTCQFSPLTRHTFDVLEVFFESSREEVFLVPVIEDIMVSLVSYISSGEKNPMDTVIFASKLLKNGLSKLHVADRSIWIKVFPLVLRSIAGLLVSETNTSSQAASILKELINHHIDQKTIMVIEDQPCDDKFVGNAESNAVGSICAVLDNILSNSGGVPNEHIMTVLSDLFLKLGEVAHFFLKGTVLKLAELARLAKEDTEMKHLQECIGSAVIAMGPEKILTLIPVCFQAEKLSCSNIWLVPILKKYVVGASLKYFVEHIALLVDSLQQACGKVKKSSVRKNLQTCLHDLWDLLPAFCRYPTDTHKSFGSLAKYFIVLLKKESSMHANISLALQELVNQNRNVLGCTGGMGEFARHSTADTVDEPNTESRVVSSHYTMKIATRNIKVLASYSVDLLQALTDVFFDSPPEQRSYLKEAIGCLASITEISEVKKIFISLLEKFQFINETRESEKLESDKGASVDVGGTTETKEHREAQRCMIMEFASSLVGGANEDLINIIFDYIKPSLQATDGVGQYEAYYTLSRIFEEHSWFYTSRFDELMELLVGVKVPVDIPSLRGRFACFHILLVYILKSDSEKQNGKAFLILNEIILTLKDSNEELRKEAYDVLLKISCSLKNSSSVDSDSPHQKLFNMIMGYLSGASPSIMSGAVAALSLLIYKENDYCFSVPDLVPSVLALLQSKTKEVIKVVLGFVKVLVSCLQASDLQKLLPDIVNGVVPWSSVSRNHFRSKVIVILEIVIRKCGSSSVELVTPEKYKRFIKTVKEQIHGKTSSSHTEISDSVPKLAVSSRGLKRSHGELYSVEGTNSRKSQSDQEKRGRRNIFNTPNKNDGSRFFPKNERFNSDKTRENLSGSSRQQYNRRDFNKRPTGESKEKTFGRNSSKPFHKPGISNSKFHKRNKPAGRQQGNKR